MHLCAHRYWKKKWSWKSTITVTSTHTHSNILYFSHRLLCTLNSINFIRWRLPVMRLTPDRSSIFIQWILLLLLLLPLCKAFHRKLELLINCVQIPWRLHFPSNSTPMDTIIWNPRCPINKSLLMLVGKVGTYLVFLFLSNHIYTRR